MSTKITIKNFIKSNFSSFVYFYRYLGYKIFVLIFLSMAVGILDGFGLALFIPLFQYAGGDNNVSGGSSLGQLDFLVDAIEATGFNLTMNVVLFVMLIMFVVKGAFRYLEAYYKVYLRVTFVKKMRYELTDGLVNYRYKNFSTTDAGRIQNTLTGESLRAVQSFVNYFSVIQASILIMVYVSLALTANYQFAILVIIGGLFTNIIFRYFYKLTKKLSKKISLTGHVFQSFLIQCVQYFKYLKATYGIAHYGELMKGSIDNIEREQKRMGGIDAISKAIREPLVIAIVVIVILVQVNFLEGSLGGILLSLMLFYRSLNSLMTLQTSWNNYYANSGALDSIMNLLKEFKNGKENLGKQTFHGLSQNLKAANISLSFDGSRKVIDQVNVSVVKNQTVAFVGESGAGKTTMVNLLCGLINPDQGEILVDGQNLNTLDKTQYRAKIGYITQEPVIFNDSVFNNVTFWDEQTQDTQKRFEHAIKLAHIYDYVQQLPDKQNAILGDQGLVLSGGQKQRISIARELYKNCEILVLDEATSALDSETEKIIQENVDQLKGRFTILIIAHRLSTIRNSDLIYVMKNGQVVDSGSFEDLIEHSTTFKNMVKFQDF